MKRNIPLRLSLTILLVGIVVALFFRNKPSDASRPIETPSPVDVTPIDRPSPSSPKRRLDSRSDTETTPMLPEHRRANTRGSRAVWAAPPLKTPITVLPKPVLKTTPFQAAHPIPSDHSPANTDRPHDPFPVPDAASRTRAPSPRPHLAPTLPDGRQPGEPPRDVNREVDRAPTVLQFHPARHPLSHNPQRLRLPRQVDRSRQRP